MSKIIKASHLIMVRERNNEQENCLEETLTKENMAVLYDEAKVMIEELITEAKLKAEGILNHAKNTAEEIIESARQEAEKIKEAVYNDGFQKGTEAGLLDVQELKIEAHEIIQQAYKERKKIIENMENEIVDFTMRLAEKLVRSQIDNNPELTGSIVRDLLNLVQDSTQVTVKLNVSDYENLEKQKDQLQSILNYGVLNLEADCTLKKGDCVVVSETGIMVAKIDDQLEKLHNILREVTNGD